jgi:hypothetical protein
VHALGPDIIDRLTFARRPAPRPETLKERNEDRFHNLAHLLFKMLQPNGLTVLVARVRENRSDIWLRTNTIHEHEIAWLVLVKLMKDCKGAAQP